MTASPTIHTSRRAQAGFSIVEIMVGVLIGLIAILVIYQMFATSEGIKRNTTSMNEAQQNGMLASFMLGIEIGNAGNGLSDSINELGNCLDTGSAVTTPRPLPVLITAGATDADPDSIVVNYSTANVLTVPALFVNGAAAGATTFDVQSPHGFKQGDIVVAVSNPGGAGACDFARVTGAPTAADPNGMVTVPHTATAAAYSGASQLINLGQANQLHRVSYGVTNGALEATNYFDANGVPNAQVPNPIASNVVNLKMQYGIDAALNGNIAWTPATGAWSAANLLTAPAATLKQIKAVRIGIVVRSEQFDKELIDPIGQPWKMFDNTVLGTVLPTSNPPGNWRLRTYETVIPLRNQLWN